MIWHLYKNAYVQACCNDADSFIEIFGGDGFTGAVELISGGTKALSQVSAFSKTAEELSTKLNDIYYELSDIADTLRFNDDSGEYTRNDLELIEERLKKCDITLKRCSHNKTKIYYSEKDNLEYILKTYDLNPEECLFIDDVKANVKAAEEAGIKGFLFQNNYEKLKEVLTDIIE